MSAHDTFAEDFGLSGIKRNPTATAPGFKEWDGVLITEPGAYRGVAIARYHGAEICSAPSISSSGLKILAAEKGARKKGQTPRHFWEQSNLNPARKVREDTDALRLGRAFHDALLLPEAWESDYFILPEGFSRAAKVKMAAEIAQADAAIAAGQSCMTMAECGTIEDMVDAIRADAQIADLISVGEPEVTFAWQDEETGIWLRARPDWMRPDRDIAMNVKTAADASWTGFSRVIADMGYAQSAALELDGYLAVFGDSPTRYFHPVVEKPGKGYATGDYIATALYELPAEDIERGRFLNRMAIRRMAECLKSGEWAGYTPEPELCGLPSYARHVIDNGGAAEPFDDDLTAGN